MWRQVNYLVDSGRTGSVRRLRHWSNGISGLQTEVRGSVELVREIVKDRPEIPRLLGGAPKKQRGGCGKVRRNHLYFQVSKFEGANMTRQRNLYSERFE